MNFNYTQFNHTTDINQRNLYSQLETNLKDFMDWSFLQINGYNNVKIASGVSLEHYTLHNVDVSGVGLPQNTVWESPFKDWVWEDIEGKNITEISGVNLNGTFLPAPTGSGNYGYHINYPLGRVVFNKPINANSNVKLEYSYRQIQIYKSEDSPWWKEVQRINYGIFNNDQFTGQLLSEHRLQAPFIMIENIARNQQIPYEVGNSRNILVQDVLLHVFAKNPTQRSNIIDILLTQKDKGLILYNVNNVVSDQVSSLNYRGEKQTNGLNYSQLVTNNRYIFKTCFIKNSVLSELNNFSSSLFNGVIRWTIEILP
jgi:hypothetical protein